KEEIKSIKFQTFKLIISKPTILTKMNPVVEKSVGDITYTITGPGAPATENPPRGGAVNDCCIM
ncbi:28224_t:CDS:1, partial [Racocetra persica]